MDITNGKYWDFSWNPIRVRGGKFHCTKCSPGCLNCWAERYNQRFQPGWKYDDREVEFTLDEKTLGIPRRRKKPAVYFVQDLGDLFHEQVPVGFTCHIFDTAQECSRHTFLFLTKRPRMMVKHLIGKWESPTGNTWQYIAKDSIIENVWWGVTICNQAEADEKIPYLIQIPGPKWLSIEPLRGPIDLDSALPVIIGAESLGSKPGRECKIEWIRDIVKQCQAAEIPCFVKQIHINGKLSRDPAEWPEDLRVRELIWRK